MSEKDISEINIIYDIKRKNNISIFGSKFIENNKNICTIIVNNKEYILSEIYNIINNNNNTLKIKLKGINNVVNMSYMFYGCLSLLSLPDISGILKMLLIWVICFLDVHYYHLCLIFQNGILIMLLL